jgi:hypothetical protein
MIRATHDTGWIENGAGNFAGVHLGWDFSGKHEDCAKKVLRAFGTDLPEFPIGIDARRIARLPDGLTFREYTWKGRDKRRKGLPAALLVLDSPHALDNHPLAEFISWNQLGFWGDSDGTDKSDLVCSWAFDHFGIHVRGEAQVARLKRLVSAFESLDICLAPPGGGGFIGRSGPSFVIRSEVDAQTLSVIEEQDRAALRLEEAVHSTAIRETLAKAGRGYYALAPAWIDREAELGLKFFLNPHRQSEFNFGWFTTKELRQWAMNEGPVLIDKGLEAFEKANRNWAVDVLRRLQYAGIAVGYQRLQWADEARSRVGVFIRPPVKGAGLPKGVYPLDELAAKYPLPPVQH